MCSKVSSKTDGTEIPQVKTPEYELKMLYYVPEIRTGGIHINHIRSPLTLIFFAKKKMFKVFVGYDLHFFLIWPESETNKW